ncbi:hypothetical protein [Tateyamaria sp. syn59]|uniref:hypothetical protein n=1 Tax=Tateyamaria sp. syn59 TaxID=2576942 RepID=UPI0011BD5E73|nr:hypothetical protein [Tateyamaria sp. syn59]
MSRDDCFELKVLVDDKGHYTIEVDFFDAFDQSPTADEVLATLSKEDLLFADFDKLLDLWVSTSMGFFQAFPRLTSEAFTSANKESSAALMGFANSVASEISEVKTNGDVVTRYLIPNEWLIATAGRLGASVEILKSAHLLRRSSLSALVAEYEVFLRQLLLLVSQVQPQAFVSETETISMSEIARHSSFEDLKRSVIDQKIDQLLQQKNHVEQLEWIEKKFGVNLTSDKAIISQFNEVCQRRHLIIHNGAVVNQRYLDSCGILGHKIDDLEPIGAELRVSAKYLRRATARLFLVGYFTAHILMQKVSPSIVPVSFSNIIENSHGFLTAGLTKMARRVCEFALASNADRPRVTDATLTINLALSFYLQSNGTGAKDPGVESSLNRYDWSDTSPLYRLALACLREDYENLSALTEAAKNEGLTKVEAQTWIIFLNVRDRQDFSKHFE